MSSDVSCKRLPSSMSVCACTLDESSNVGRMTMSYFLAGAYQKRKVLAVSGNRVVVMDEDQAYFNLSSIGRRSSSGSYYSIPGESERNDTDSPHMHKTYAHRDYGKDFGSDDVIYVQQMTAVFKRGNSRCDYANHPQDMNPALPTDPDSVVREQPQSVTASAVDSQPMDLTDYYPEEYNLSQRKKKKIVRKESNWVTVLCWCPLLCPAGCDVDVPCGCCCPKSRREIEMEIYDTKH